jgi:hypothetical protein
MPSNLELHRWALQQVSEVKAAIEAYEKVITSRLAGRGLDSRYDLNRLLSIELMDDRDYADLVGEWRDRKDEAKMYGVAALVDLLSTRTPSTG